MKESKKKIDAILQHDSDKKNMTKEDSIISKLALLMEKRDKQNKNPEQKVDPSVNRINSPEDVQINKFDSQKTRIQQREPSPSNFPNENIQNEHSEQHQSTHSSSLLKNLQSWDDTDQINSIESGQVIRGTYSLDSRIGDGGMGEVWKALDLIQDAGDAKDKYVAIKFINHKIKNHPDALKALVREFARYKKLIHPNIVKAYELNRDGNEIFIVMEYLKGSSLQDFIKQHPEGVPLTQAEPIIKGMCDALEYAHNEGIVHCDFKPANVFYNQLAQVCKIIDFGIARLSRTEERDETRFDPGILGAMTTSYASSEMLIEAEPDPKDDIYSLACIVYELLSGQHPFKKSMSLKAERENMKPNQISGLKKSEFQALLHGLGFRREKRTSSATQFYSELFSPQKLANKKYIKWSIIAVLLMIIPLGAYKGYNRWQLSQVRADVHQQLNSGLSGFTSLSVDKQKELLHNSSFRLALVKIAAANKKSDTLELLSQFSRKNQQLLFSDRNIRVFLITHYSKDVGRAIKENDFTKAEQLSFSVLEQYPDSMQLIKQSNLLQSQKESRLATVELRYQQCLEDNSKNLSELFPCLQQTRKLLKKIDSSNIFMTSPSLTNRYSVEISSAIKNKNLSLAQTLLANWRTLEKNKINERTRLEQNLTRITAFNKTQIQTSFDFDNRQNDIDQVQATASEQGDLYQRINRLLTLAEQQSAKKQLMTPVEDSALQTYQKILDIAPDNEQALAGINTLIETYVIWAKEEIKRGNFQHAEYLFNRALSISPSDNDALSGIASLSKDNSETQRQLQQAIAEQSNQELYSEKSAKDRPVVVNLLDKAEQQIVNKMLVSPAKDNAWKTYKKILQLDPGNRQALRGINKITNIYILRAKKKLETGNYRHSGYLFDKALMVSPGNKDALSGLSSLKKYR